MAKCIKLSKNFYLGLRYQHNNRANDILNLVWKAKMQKI